MLVAEKLVSGGRLPIKDQSSDRKVRDAQEGYLRLLGRWSLLCKNLLCAFIFSSLEKYKGCGIFNGGSKKGAGSRRGGCRQQDKRVEESPQHLSMGWRVFCLHPLRVPEIINMRCHSCFSGGDFIQSL